MPFCTGRNEDFGDNFRGPAALHKAATTALNKDKAVRVRKGGFYRLRWLAIVYFLGK